jgi:uncharacterized membrane protein YdcZ (DUF606 family)
MRQALRTAAGIFVAVGQASLLPVVGVALFTLASVTGQTIAGLLADRWHWEEAIADH